MHTGLARVLSWIWPVTILKADGRHGPLEIRWERGRKVLNSRNANQSFGSLHRVWQRTLVPLVREIKPSSVLVLGFGGGSIAEILINELKLDTKITAIEIDPIMIALAKDQFQWEGSNDLILIQGDAIVQIHSIKERFDLVLVDLFDDLDLARGIDTNGFIHCLRDRCNERGIVCFNTVSHNVLSAERCDKIALQLKQIFHSMIEFKYEGVNRMFVSR